MKEWRKKEREEEGKKEQMYISDLHGRRVNGLSLWPYWSVHLSSCFFFVLQSPYSSKFSIRSFYLTSLLFNLDLAVRKFSNSFASCTFWLCVTKNNISSLHLVLRCNLQTVFAVISINSFLSNQNVWPLN